jgi:hypothetical protein
MTEPGGVGTEAGRTLLRELRDEAPSGGAADILAIEAEAIYIGAMAERERIVRAVEGLPTLLREMFGAGLTVTDLIDRAAVLAALRDEP